MNYAPHVERIYFADECVICGTEFYLLKDIETGVLFYYCAACGCAYSDLKEQLNIIESYTDFAPNGVDVANLNDIENLGISFELSESNTDHHNVMLSDAWVYTNLKQKNFSKVREICEHAIGAWHHPPQDFINILKALEKGETQFEKIWKST